MKRYRNTLMLVVAVMAIFASASGLTNAFLTNETEELNNVITPGGIAVRLSEPGWRPEEAKNLTPCAEVSKDPVVTNNGENDIWAFLRIDIPIKNIVTVNTETKRKEAKKNTELFRFVVQPQWTLVDKTSDSGTAHYVYGFNKVLPPGESSPALFEEVELVNFLEGEIDEAEQLVIPVEALAIQSNVEMKENGLPAIYAEYLEQKAADTRGGNQE